MGLEQLYNDYNIEIAPKGHKHNREGWLNTACPVCASESNIGYHLGFNVHGSYFTCYHCGGLPITKTIAQLTGSSFTQAQDLIKKYDIKNTKLRRTEAPVTINIKPLKFPTYTEKMGKAHKRYLEERGYNADYLEKEFGLLGTGPLSRLDGIEYKFRILAPIYWNGKLVSFQTRDYTKKHQLRYITCPKAREKIHHKHILYCKSNEPAERGIIVEGIFDVWRFGEFGYSTFGIGYTPQQVRAIKKILKKVVVVFDPDKNAQKRAKELVKELLFAGIDAQNILLDKDPGDLTQKEANSLLKKLKFV